MTRVTIAIWLLATVSAAAALPAAEHAVNSRSKARLSRFNRTYLRADEITGRSWSERYLPIDTDEFEELLAAARAAVEGAPAATRCEHESARYTARLLGDDLLVGTAELVFTRRGAGAVMLPLDPCNLAIGSAEWSDSGSKPATLGVSPQGTQNVLVEGSQLSMSWSLRGERTASGAVRFQLELPKGPIARLNLEVPATSQVSVDHGVAGRDATPGAAKGSWVVELGGQRELNLRVLAEDAARQRRPLTLLRQSVTYEVSTRGISVVAQLKLDIHGEPLERVALDLDPTLRLVTARYGEQEIPWAATADVETRMSHVVLQLPEPIAGTGRVLQLSAIAPLVTGKTWRLPALRPQGMSWQEGTAELLIPNLFTVEQLAMDGCRQSRITPLPAPLAGESIEIQYFRPGATMDVIVAQPRERLKVDCGALVEVGSTQVSSLVGIQLALARGQRRAAQIDVRAGWVIDSVDSVEAKRPVQWEVEEPTDEHARLKIRFSAPITADSPARLAIRGHRAATTSASHEAAQLEMLSLDPFQRGTRLISVRAAEGSELHWSGVDELTRLDPLKLSAAEVKLFMQPPAEAVFPLDAAFGQASLMLERRKPTYTVDVRIDAALEGKSLTETYTLACLPEAARVERLLVHLSQPREVPLEWSLAGGNSGQFSARKLSAAEQAQATGHANGEVWELNARVSRAGPFELRGFRTTSIEGEASVSLASVAEAASQRGTVAVRALGNTPLAIKNRGLTPAPAELVDASRYQTARATYHYQPSRDDVGPEAELIVAIEPRVAGQLAAWAWSHQLESRIAADGLAIHRATFRIQSSGRRRVQLSLPAEASLRAVWLDGERLSTTSSQAGGRVLADLPPGKAFVTLTAEFTTPGELPAWVAKSEPPFADLDIPVIARQWSLWLPPGYAVADASNEYPTHSILPPTWSQRLFGSLGRGMSQKLFNPLVAGDWRNALATTDGELSRQAAEQFAETMGTMLAEYRSVEALTWGQLLALCEETDRQPRRELLVDAESLAWSGLGSQSVVRFPEDDSALERACSLLEQNHLVLLASGDAIVLTTASAAASQACQLVRTKNGIFFPIAAGPLADEVQHATQQGQWSPYRTVEVWNAAVDVPEGPWLSPGNAATLDEPQGWTAYSVHFSDTRRPDLRIVHTSMTGVLAWAVFLSIAACGLWRRLLRPEALVALIALSAAAALLLPATYAPLASAALLGGLFSLVLRITRVPPVAAVAADPSRGSRKMRSSVVHEMARLLLLAGLLHLAWQAHADEPAGARLAPDKQQSPGALPHSAVDASPGTTGESTAQRTTLDESPVDAAAEPIYRVLIPTDEDQRPLGNKCYLPEEFFRQLHRQSDAASAAPRDWLLTRASYLGSLARDGVHHRLGLMQLKAVFDIRVLTANVRVRIPLARDAIGKTIVGARLDGRPIPVTWAATGDAFELAPLAEDRYRLELDLQPTQAADTSFGGFDLPVPQLSNASLALTFPTDGPAVEVPSARGQVETDTVRGELVAQLGPADRLTVRWPVNVGPELAPPSLEVDELIWVKVRPGTTVIDAKFKYRILGGRVQQIRLLTDPRLRPLPPTSPQSPIAAIHTIPGDPQKIELDLHRPIVDQVTIELSFLVTNTSGVGNLRLPRLESSMGRANKRWLAVSVDPALQPRIQAGEESKTLEIPEFTAVWGESDVRPQAAYSVPRGEPVWVLSTQPSEARTSVEQSLSLSLGSKSTLLKYDAQLSISGGHLLQLSLQGPSKLSVEQVSLLEDDVQRVARFAVSEHGRVTIFLNAPLDGRQRLTLDGHWDRPPGQEFVAPKIELVGADTKKNQLHVYRQPAVLVSVQKSPQTNKLSADNGAAIDGLGALLGSYSLDDPTAAVTITLTPNVPKSRGVSITTLRRDGDRWMAELDHRLDISDGLVDALHFEIPAQWTEPYSIEPAAEYKIISIPGELRPQLVVYPQKPLSGKHRFKIRGRVALSAGDRLRAPDIVPLRVGQLERFVVLPQRLEGQQVDWDTFRLSRATSPPERADIAVGEDQALYQVAGERFQASLKAVQRSSATARVALADIHLMWQGDGSCQGIAAFDLEPRGATSCVLGLPSGCRLMHATVESLPALVAPIDPSHSRVSLASAHLPQRIEVVFTASWSSSSSYLHVQVPRLEGLEVGTTLWTVYGPPSLGPGTASARASSVTAADHELVRLKTVSSLVQLPAEFVGEHLPEEIARWYRPWRRRYSLARNNLELMQTHWRRGTGPSELDVDARNLDKQMTAVDARIGGSNSAGRGASVSSLSELLKIVDNHRVPTHYLVRGESHDLELRYGQAPSNSLWRRALAALFLLLLGSATVYWLANRPLPVLAPTAVMALVGLSWWLLLEPSIIGLSVVAVAGWFAFRNAQQSPVWSQAR